MWFIGAYYGERIDCALCINDKIKRVVHKLDFDCFKIIVVILLHKRKGRRDWLDDFCPHAPATRSRLGLVRKMGGNTESTTNRIMTRKVNACFTKALTSKKWTLRRENLDY